MEQFKRLYNKKERANLVFNLLIYLIFFVYSFYIVITNPQEPFSWLIGVVAVIFVAFSLLKEFLGFSYKKAIHLLTVERNPEAGLTQIKVVEKYDLLKSFKAACLIYTVLVHLDRHDTDTLNTTLQSFETTQTKDLVLVKAYAHFKIQVFKKNKTQMKKAYASLHELKNLKHKGKPVFTPLFAWEDIEAEYEYLMNDYKKANSLLTNLNTSAMNPRELDQHNLLLAKVFIQLGKQKEALPLLQSIASTSKLNAYGQEAAQCITTLKEPHESSSIHR